MTFKDIYNFGGRSSVTASWQVIDQPTPIMVKIFAFIHCNLTLAGSLPTYQCNPCGLFLQDSGYDFIHLNYNFSVPCLVSMVL